VAWQSITSTSSCDSGCTDQSQITISNDSTHTHERDCERIIFAFCSPMQARPWAGVIGTHQGGMLVRTPLVEAEQDRSIRIQDLTKVVMARRRLGLTKERLVPSQAARDVVYANDCPCSFHRISAVGLTYKAQRRRRQEARTGTRA
jgi:hypothetical protein